jgi:putative transposase
MVNYIKNQELQHPKKSFREEYIDFFEKFQVDYEEKFIFKELI